MLAKSTDVFDALRTVFETLGPFDPADQELVLRWTRERLGIVGGPPASIGAIQQTGTMSQHAVAARRVISQRRPRQGEMKRIRGREERISRKRPVWVRSRSIGPVELRLGSRPMGNLGCMPSFERLRGRL